VPRFKHPELVRFLRTVDQLEILPRTGYFFAGIRQPESIAAHSYGVALIAMLLADRIKSRVNIERVLRLAILHDTAESLLTDIPNSSFAYMDQAHKEQAEVKAAKELFGGLTCDYIEFWKEFEEGKTLEARLVRAADKLQLAVKIIGYEQSGQGNFDRFWQNMRHQCSDNFRGIELAKELFDDLLCLRDS